MSETNTKTPKAQKPATQKKSAGWGRGWHLKKEFTAPNGEKYSFGKLVSGITVSE